MSAKSIGTGLLLIDRVTIASVKPPMALFDGLCFSFGTIEMFTRM